MTDVGAVAAVIDVVAVTADLSLVVLIVGAFEPAAALFVNGAACVPTRRVAVVDAGRAHVPPLFARVTTTVPLAFVEVAEQFVNPERRVTTGAAGTEVPFVSDAIVSVIVLPLASAPPPLGVKPAVQVAEALAVAGCPVYDAAVTGVGSIVYGSGSLESSSTRSIHQPAAVWRSTQRDPRGVTSRPERS